jgi:uncharacterized membrane protein YsdA (DUF1294 family)/cold shock CspA family protein
MRFEGKLKTWNDERGFGFIEPVQGGQEIFVHIKSFAVRDGRPEPGQLLSFEVEIGPQGKKRAKNVGPVRARQASRPRTYDAPAQWGLASRLAIPAFIALYAVLAVRWHVPWFFAAAYLGLSFVTLMTYAFDKSAAIEGRWRTSERGLLLLGVLGGWPGAILGQQLLRHKSSKREFRNVFWATVVVNVGAFVSLNSPVLSYLRR